ncbi:exosortase K [Thermoflexibacter ruber]|uniref:Exosortase K n=1 Tax=Thermoflexibacter ruber TaxID=1003 RepID=A0A1I2IFC0_9BACT|nr:exosortase K [Thermoflexibacter ruber]SFF40320.1 exosortase K [Thermoflexibacter ruber]
MDVHTNKRSSKKIIDLFSSLLYHLPFLCIGLGIKYFYSVANNEQLNFILYPTHLLVEMWTGSQGIFEAEKGYVFSLLGICIDKSCAGLNFWVIAFLSGGFAWAMRNPRLKGLPFYLLFLLCITFLITIFTNSSRIFIAVISLKTFPNLARLTWFHEALGTFVFINALLLFYLGISYFINKVQFYRLNLKS